MEVKDAENNTLELGDKVFAGRAGYCYRAYIYRIDHDKVCLSHTDPKVKKVQYTGYSFFGKGRFSNIGKGRFSNICYSLLKDNG